MNNRINSFSTLSFERGWSDWIKLVAAIMVALSHYSTVIVFNNHWSSNPIISLLAQGGYIGVAIFFFFSGYGLMESESKQHLTITQFLKKRLVKVYLPVLLVSFLWIPIYYYVNHEDISITFGGILYDIFWGFRDCVLWFVKILFFLYILFYFFSLGFNAGYKILSNILLLCGLVLVMYIGKYYNFPIISIPYFVIGVYASLYKQVRVCKIPFTLFVLFIFGIVCALLYILNPMPEFAHATLNTIMLFIMVLMFKYINKSPKISLSGIWLTSIYTIYIVHFKVLDFMVWQWGYISIYSWLIVTLVITLIVSYLRKLLRI